MQYSIDYKFYKQKKVKMYLIRHPKIMQRRVSFSQNKEKNRWLVLDFYKEAFKRGFRG